MSVDQTLAGIDAALESWEGGPDAARWHADGGPDKLAAADAAEHLARWISGIAVSFAEFGRLVTMTIVPSVDGFVKGIASVMHTLSALQFPRLHRRCDTCHPHRAKPLAIDGREYRRRQLARRRRRR